MKNKQVTHKQVCKFTEKFDNQCSDSWLTDILNNEIFFLANATAPEETIVNR